MLWHVQALCLQHLQATAQTPVAYSWSEATNLTEAKRQMQRITLSSEESTKAFWPRTKIPTPYETIRFKIQVQTYGPFPAGCGPHAYMGYRPMQQIWDRRNETCKDEDNKNIRVLTV
jgi:hypothetical protein